MKMHSKMKKYILAFLLTSVIFISCQNGSKSNNTKAEAEPALQQAVVADSIPYKILEKYFVKNTIKELPDPKIETEEQFKNVFSPAAIMGEDGKPTVIDFSKQYIIAVTKLATDTALKIIPVSLLYSADRTIVYTYRLEKGTKQSYSVKPVLGIVVDRKYTGKIELKEE